MRHQEDFGDMRDAAKEQERRGDWIQTRTGKFWPLDPRAEDVRIDDIAFALSNLCRFGGHVPFYSVAQHSVLVAGVLIDSARSHLDPRIGLLHDAAEAYLVDVPRPIKRQLSIYLEAEDLVLQAIGERFNLVLTPMAPPVKAADDRMLAIEKRDLLEPMRWEMSLPDVSMYARVVPWAPDVARAEFMRAWEAWS